MQKVIPKEALIVLKFYLYCFLEKYLIGNFHKNTYTTKKSICDNAFKCVLTLKSTKYFEIKKMFNNILKNTFDTLRNT